MAEDMQPIKRIVILGGGSAGFMAALSVLRFCPQLEVTLVHTDKVPPIGVGESTTGWIPDFLHRFLGIDRAAFFAAVRPSIKLGIRFEWGPAEISHFNYTFDNALDVRDSRLLQGNGNYCLYDMEDNSLFSALMNRNRAPAFFSHDGRLQVQHGFGYHVDTNRLIGFLEREAIQRGLRIVKGSLAGVQKEGSGDVRGLVLDSGQEITADFFIDSSGFRSLLLGGAQAEEFVSFADSLFCDKAAVAHFERDQAIQPYTTATTMDNGWCWRIDLPESISCGYVFSSQFCREEQACQALLDRHPQICEPPRIVNFRSGRFRRFWVRNVAAVGNACGFVEPLESTGLHMAASAAKIIAETLVDSQGQPSPPLVAAANRLIASQWDDVRACLALHYKLNERLDTPFWRHCREATHLADAATIVEMYEEAGPASLLGTVVPRGSLFGIDGYLTLLVGQRAPTRFQPLITEESERRWHRIRQEYRDACFHALTVEDFLQVVTQPRSLSAV